MFSKKGLKKEGNRKCVERIQSQKERLVRISYVFLNAKIGEETYS